MCRGGAEVEAKLGERGRAPSDGASERLDLVIAQLLERKGLARPLGEAHLGGCRMVTGWEPMRLGGCRMVT